MYMAERLIYAKRKTVLEELNGLNNWVDQVFIVQSVKDKLNGLQ